MGPTSPKRPTHSVFSPECVLLRDEKPGLALRPGFFMPVVNNPVRVQNEPIRLSRDPFHLPICEYLASLCQRLRAGHNLEQFPCDR